MNRIIIHIDMNSYFASVEQQANPFLRGKPIGIIGKNQKRTILATASTEAKRLGVKTAMTTWEAKQICQSIILWPGDPEKYSDITLRFNSIYRDFTDKVEEFSVDESFLDVTESAKDYFGAVCIAQTIRERIKEECGEFIKASIGIAPNRLIAKLASESVKPNGLTVVCPNQVLDLLDRSKLDDLCGIGQRTLHKLENLGITTFRQLREFPVDELVREFKSYGIWLHEAACGNEPPALSNQKSTDKTAAPKSYGHSYTLPYDTNNRATIKRYLFSLADKIVWRMRRDNVCARRVTAFLRFGDFSHACEQRSFNEPITDGKQLFEIAWSIYTKIFQRQLPRNRKPIRLVGISASLLCNQQTTVPLFKKDRELRSLLSCLDKLQRRYGNNVWKRASTLPITIKQRSSGFGYDHEN